MLDKTDAREDSLHAESRRVSLCSIASGYALTVVVAARWQDGSPGAPGINVCESDGCASHLPHPFGDRAPSSYLATVEPLGGGARVAMANESVGAFSTPPFLHFRPK